MEILEPPSDVKKIIDVLIQKIESNGEKFADMINEHMKDNKKYDFLRSDDDPYRPYYLKQLQQMQNLKLEKEAQEIEKGVQGEKQSDIRGLIFGEDDKAQDQELEQEEKEEIIAPEIDQFQIENPPNLVKTDQDIIKLSAQFVAANGSQFLQQLTEKMTRQQGSRRGQFDFLNPTHNLFGYFTGLVEQYSKVIQSNEEGGTRARIQKYANDKEFIMKIGNQRYIFEKYQQEQIKYKEKLKKAGIDPSTIMGDAPKPEDDDGIDWHDFIVVQTIDLFDENDDGQSVLDTQNNVKNNKLNQISQQIQNQQDFENQQNKQNFEPKPKVEILQNQALDPQMKVKHNYTRQSINMQEQKKEIKIEGQKSQKCPKCGKFIKVVELEAHMKVCMMNTQNWLQQKQDREQRQGLPSLAENDEITKNLKRFASQRPDLYSGGQDNKVEQSEAQIKQQVIWDGQSTSLTRTHANVAMMQAQQKKNMMDAEKAKLEKRQKF